MLERWDILAAGVVAGFLTVPATGINIDWEMLNSSSNPIQIPAGRTVFFVPGEPSPVQQLNRRPAVGIIVDDIQAAVGLLDVEHRGQWGTDGIKQHDAIDPA